MATAHHSLSRRIIAAVLISELLCGVAFSAVALLHEHGARLHAFDVMLRGRCDSLLGAVDDLDDPGDHLALTTSDLQPAPEDAYFVAEQDGRPVGSSPTWNTGFAVPAQNGFSEQTVGHRRYRLFRTESTRYIDANTPHRSQRPVIAVYAVPTRHLWHGIFEAVRFYIASILLLLCVTAIALAWTLRRVMQPLRDLASEAAKVTAHSWQFAPSPEVQQTTELRPLASSISDLLRNLEAEFAARRRFVSDAAHELKTDVAVVKSSLQLLAMRPRTPEEYSAGIVRTLDDTARMETLVGRMLLLGRADESERGEEAIDFAAALQQTLVQLEPMAELRGVKVRHELQSALPVALSWDNAVTLCSNLIVNAIEHSGTMREVTVELRHDADRAILAVSDCGEGIAPEALPHIFDRFFRADSSRTRATGGAGLGLAICKAIATSAGGTIDIESAVGSGTTVNVILPLAGAARPR